MKFSKYLEIIDEAEVGSKYRIMAKPTNFKGKKVFQIIALKAFHCPGLGPIKKGEKGGMIEKESNLSQTGNCWIDLGSVVYGNAIVYGNATISGEDIEIYDNAKVYGNAVINQNEDGSPKIYGNAKIFGKAKIKGEVKVYGNAIVKDEAEVEGDVFGDVVVSGTGFVAPGDKVSGKKEYNSKISTKRIDKGLVPDWFKTRGR